VVHETSEAAMFRPLLLSVLGLSFVASLAAAEQPRPAASAGGVVVRRVTEEPADLKTLTAAQQALKDALAALEKAEAALAAADGDAAAKEAQKVVAEARRALGDTLRKVGAQNTQILNKAAAGQAVFVRQGFPGNPGVAERENVDPQDPIERFALLTAGGPVVIQATITIDGQPFRTVREKLIDEMLAAADKDKDGKATWDEALTAARFTLGRIGAAGEQQRKSYAQTFDKNADGLVDRGEARLFVAQVFQGATFNLSGGYGGAYGFSGGGAVVVDGRMMYGGGQADVRALLDADSDGTLSDKEIAAAAERLKSRDADDNDLLYPTEISSPAAAAPVRINQAQMAAQATQNAILLGPTAKADTLHASLVQRYKNAEGQVVSTSFAAVPKLFAALDKNSDGALQAEETLALNEVPPHVTLAVDLGASGKAKGLSVMALSDEVSKTHATADSVKLELPGVRVALSANLNASQTYNFGQSATAMITNYDKDSNQYLEKSELPGNLAGQFDSWDGDGDGKVYAAEITASYARMMAPQASQVAAGVANQGNSLFQTLDQTGDGRLSLREMRAAAERMKPLDANDDGKIGQGEIPATMTISFGLGNAGYGVYSSVNRPGGQQPAAPAAARDVPEWFARMDRNGDGDVTLKEFLGDEADFKKLDANSDGFVEAKEAKAAAEAAK
jgi:Ca2+-binding EF-hand superfamily protein